MNNIVPHVGKAWTHDFVFTQEDVQKFAEVSGDRNPVHLDEAYAAQTPFRKPIIHGFLSGSVFSKCFGTLYPGEGTIYLAQSMIFKRPMFVGVAYVARFSILEIDPVKFTIMVDCRIEDPNEKSCIEGSAKLLNQRIFG